MSEQLHGSHEKSLDLATEAAEQKELIKSREQSAEKHESNEHKEHDARKEAIELAELTEAKTLEEKVDVIEHEHGAKQRQDSYEQTMVEVRSQLSPNERLFSSVIHNPVVEKASDFVGKTVARPDSIVSGSLFAFLAVAILYGIAQFNSFALSGFETIGAFVLGWILGLIFDAIRFMIKR